VRRHESVSSVRKFVTETTIAVMELMKLSRDVMLRHLVEFASKLAYFYCVLLLFTMYQKILTLEIIKSKII